MNRGDEDPCYERPCTANEHCCPAQVCIDVDGGRSFKMLTEHRTQTYTLFTYPRVHGNMKTEQTVNNLKAYNLNRLKYQHDKFN